MTDRLLKLLALDKNGTLISTDSKTSIYREEPTIIYIYPWDEPAIGAAPSIIFIDSKIEEIFEKWTNM